MDLVCVDSVMPRYCSSSRRTGGTYILSARRFCNGSGGTIAGAASRLVSNNLVVVMCGRGVVLRIAEAGITFYATVGRWAPPPFSDNLVVVM